MQRLLLSLGLVAIAVLAAACSSGSGAATASPAGSPADGIVVVAKGVTFSTATIAAPAGEPFQIVLDNQESVPHNFAIKDGSGTVIFKGEVVTQTQVVNNVAALAAGTYQFYCEVHPTMTGTLTAS
jgi:plastocyanin